MISFLCPRCKTAHQVASYLGGSKIKCTSCGQRMLVPLSTSNATALQPTPHQWLNLSRRQGPLIGIMAGLLCLVLAIVPLALVRRPVQVVPGGQPKVKQVAAAPVVAAPVILTPAPGKAFLETTGAEWTKQLKNGSSGERRSAAFALGKMGARAIPFLGDMKQAAAREREAKVRESILFALGQICRDNDSLGGDLGLEQLCLDGLRDDDAFVRRSAAYALGCLGSKSALARSALDTALDDGNPAVRQNAAWALGKIGAALGQEAVAMLPSLRKALHDRDSLVKRDAAGALLGIAGIAGVHDLVADLLPLCGDGNSEVRRAALGVLVRVVKPADKSAITLLRAALEDFDLENKRNAALALTNIGGPETAAALPILLDAIRTGEPELRRQAVLAIRNIGPAASGAVPTLIHLLRTDMDEKVRHHAVLALWGIGKTAAPAVPALLEHIQDTRESPRMRHDCVMALTSFGSTPSTKNAIPTLLAMLGDAKLDANVRLRIPAALSVHGAYLKSVDGALPAFVKALNEPGIHPLVRYETAVRAATVWQAESPEAFLDVLSEGLHDPNLKIMGKTESGVGGISSETASGKATIVTQRGGDWRVSIVSGIQRIGPKRYSQRPDIMEQLAELAQDRTIYEPLRRISAELLKAAEGASPGK